MDDQSPAQHLERHLRGEDPDPLPVAGETRHAVLDRRVAHLVGTAGASGVESYLLALLPSFDPAAVRPALILPRPGVLVDRVRATIAGGLAPEER